MPELTDQLRELISTWEKISAKIDTTANSVRIRELQAASAAPGFWNDPNSARAKMSQLSELEAENAETSSISDRLSSVKEMLDSPEAASLADELSQEVADLEAKIKTMENKLFLSGPYDGSGAILSIHAGQGGTEAMDWAEMLLRMYLRFFEKQGWAAEIVDESKGEEAGLKSVTVQVEGRDAYGYLKHESGAHRLVRQSPFNADHLRQTSFALVEVMPIIAETTELNVKPDEIKLDAFRSSGAGGQNVNKVNSAVRLTHLPTGITVSVQTERSQLQNREYAMRILLAKLWELEEAKRRGEIKEIKGEYKPASWGNQIRSYVLHPYKMVKDLRTGTETSDAEGVLDGNLSKFIESELRSLSSN